MNYYYIIFRLKSDPLGSKRRWEDFANSESEAIGMLCEYVISEFAPQDVFSTPFPEIIILSKSEYLSVFK